MEGVTHSNCNHSWGNNNNKHVNSKLLCVCLCTLNVTCTEFAHFYYSKITLNKSCKNLKCTFYSIFYIYFPTSYGFQDNSTKESRCTRSVMLGTYIITCAKISKTLSSYGSKLSGNTYQIQSHII